MDINKLNPGDLIINRNHDTGEVDVQKVIATHAKAKMGPFVMNDCLVTWTPDLPKSYPELENRKGYNRRMPS